MLDAIFPPLGVIVAPSARFTQMLVATELSGIAGDLDSVFDVDGSTLFSGKISPPDDQTARDSVASWEVELELTEKFRHR